MSRLRYMAIFVFLAFFSGILCFLNFYVGLALFFLSFISGAYVVCIYAKKRVEFLDYYYTPHHLFIEKGVFLKQKIKILLKNVQYVDKTTALDQNFFGLCTLVFHLPGSKIKLENLNNKTEANIILKELKLD